MDASQAELDFTLSCEHYESILLLRVWLRTLALSPWFLDTIETIQTIKPAKAISWIVLIIPYCVIILTQALYRHHFFPGDCESIARIIHHCPPIHSSVFCTKKVDLVVNVWLRTLPTIQGICFGSEEHFLFCRQHEEAIKSREQLKTAIYYLWCQVSYWINRLI